MGATRPQYTPVIGCGSNKRGDAYRIKSNTDRRRLNINGAMELQTYSAKIPFVVNIDPASTIALFQQIEKANPSRQALHRDLRQRPLLQFQDR